MIVGSNQSLVQQLIQEPIRETPIPDCSLFQGDRVTRNDVLIIGAGPSGLFAAAELARHGVKARLVEREVRTHHEARATALQPGTLEILDSVGLLPPFLDASERIRCSRLYGPNMAELGATNGPRSRPY